MANIFNYVEEYGDVSFETKGFNDVDNLVFSLLSYLDFSCTSINKNKHTLSYIGNEYLKQNRYKDIRKLGIAQRYAYRMLEVILNRKRYSNIILTDYVYDTNKDMQFSAVTFHISNRLKYICFEGTDELISGWKEDGELPCMFPVPSHVEAIKYVNKHVKLVGKDVIIGGHSKGGNLALVSSMYMKEYKKFKVKKVYSNDGPGLRKKEFESEEYKSIKKKYVHIVPDYSVVGVLLRSDTYVVVKSTKKNILAHAIPTWIIDDDELLLTTLSRKSKKLEKSIISWLDKHDDNERTDVVNKIFKVLEDADVTTLMNIKEIDKLIKVILNIKNMDKETKDLIIDFLTYNYKNINS